MDGLFHGKPYEQMDDLGGFPIIFGLTPTLSTWTYWTFFNPGCRLAFKTLKRDAGFVSPFFHTVWK